MGFEANVDGEYEYCHLENIEYLFELLPHLLNYKRMARLADQIKTDGLNIVYVRRWGRTLLRLLLKSTVLSAPALDTPKEVTTPKKEGEVDPGVEYAKRPGGRHKAITPPPSRPALSQYDGTTMSRYSPQASYVLPTRRLSTSSHESRVRSEC